jgi:hypothetical protein
MLMDYAKANDIPLLISTKSCHEMERWTHHVHMMEFIW